MCLLSPKRSGSSSQSWTWSCRRVSLYLLTNLTDEWCFEYVCLDEYVLILKARLRILNKSINTHQVPWWSWSRWCFNVAAARGNTLTSFSTSHSFSDSFIRLWPFNALTGLLFVSLFTLTLCKLKTWHSLCVYSGNNVQATVYSACALCRLHKLIQNTRRIFQQLAFRRFCQTKSFGGKQSFGYFIIKCS